jgi:hydrogenase maturation protease
VSAVRIVGLGSPFGDDRLGWDAIDALQALHATGGAELHRIATPSNELLPLLQGARRVILVDAVANGEPPGRLVRCGSDALRRGRGGVSSHGVSVDTVLDLAEVLEQLPDELLLIGLAIDPDASRERQTLTPQVAQALPALVAAVVAAARTGGPI